MFLATLVALHLTPVSEWVGEWAEFCEPDTSVAWSLRACFSCFLFFLIYSVVLYFALFQIVFVNLFISNLGMIMVTSVSQRSPKAEANMLKVIRKLSQLISD